MPDGALAKAGLGRRREGWKCVAGEPALSLEAVDAGCGKVRGDLEADLVLRSPRRPLLVSEHRHEVEDGEHLVGGRVRERDHPEVVSAFGEVAPQVLRRDDRRATSGADDRFADGLRHPVEEAGPVLALRLDRLRTIDHADRIDRFVGGPGTDEGALGEAEGDRAVAVFAHPSEARADHLELHLEDPRAAMPLLRGVAFRVQPVDDVCPEQVTRVVRFEGELAGPGAVVGVALEDRDRVLHGDPAGLAGREPGVVDLADQALDDRPSRARLVQDALGVVLGGDPAGRFEHLPFGRREVEPVTAEPLFDVEAVQPVAVELPGEREVVGVDRRGGQIVHR